ncbi:hypothetical protein M8C13_20540 [Crossiella sp. SN42]|uniref:hypothetical protein n=1 Tax=Crossiella sp. SN42 TaxID=2944808 RepID=UPI00207D41EF|nr:hypothetical protein [Crossiella sp. SN42]MCO1578144.1 hypothetical protein [Crossiella sp. SN42]
MLRTAPVVLGIALTLAGCAAEPAAPPSSTAPATPTREITPKDLLRAQARGSTADMATTACRQGVAATDPVCGEHLTAVEQTVAKVREALGQSVKDRDLTKANEAAAWVAKSVGQVRKMNCYGMNGPEHKPGKNESELCGSFGRLALMKWLNYQTTVERL